MKDTVNFLAGMILGAAIGAVTALLFAPQSGAELRANIQQQAIAERQRLQALYEQQMAEIQPQLDKLQSDIQTLIDNTKRAAESDDDAGKAEA